MHYEAEQRNETDGNETEFCFSAMRFCELFEVKAETEDGHCHDEENHHREQQNAALHNHVSASV